LKKCGLGFRTKRVLETAKIVDQELLSLKKLKKLDYNQAKRELLCLPGVGHKVADCILLFSLEKLEAFPIDRWIKRAAITLYSNHFESSFIQQITNKNSLTIKEYKKIGSFGRKYASHRHRPAHRHTFFNLRLHDHQREIAPDRHTG